MATITQNEWNRYVRLLRQLNEQAAFDIVTFMRNQLLHDPTSNAIESLTEAQRKELLDYAYAIVQKYGEGAAALSAEMYDAVAILEGRYVAPAELAQLANYGDVAKAVNGTLLQSSNLDEIANAAARWVKMAGADTTLHNAIRDGAQFAWVPSGETCAFCIMLASSGWQYASKKALKNGHAEHIHSNCDCQYAVRYDNRTTVAGYKPEEYRAMYYGVDSELKEEDIRITPRNRLNAMRRNAYADGNSETLIDV